MNAPTRIVAVAAVFLIFGIPLARLGGQESRSADQLKAGEFKISGPYSERNLSIFLIHGQDSLKGKPVITLEEALKTGKLVVHETGQVNELAVEGLFLFVGEALACYIDDQVPPVGRLAGKTFRLDGPL